MAFGLVSTQSVTSYKSLNSRRKIFLQYPTGAAPLMGLLSYLPTEETDKVEFGWFERRFPTQKTTTVASGTAPFLNGDGSAFSDGGTMTANQEYIVKVADTSQFKATHVIVIRDLLLSTATYVDMKGTVTQVVSSTQLKFRPYQTRASVQNGTTDNNSLTVAIIGNANQEGGRSGTGILTYPINPTNYTQIFRSAFNISRTALKQGLTYDSSGPYKTLAWDNGLRHMIEMEKAAIWGERSTKLVTDPTTGDSVPETTMGGIYWFLEQYEAADSIYRGGTGAAAVTSNSDDDKRIIDLGGSLTKADYNTYISRLFRKTNDKAYEKLCLCGGRTLEVINSLFERDITRNVALSEKERNFEFIVHSHTTLRGTVHYKVHPLFDNDADLQDQALFLDLGNVKWRPLTDSDTKFLKGRQENDRDGRKDEWITEAGIEVHFPESFMYWKNCTAAA